MRHGIFFHTLATLATAALVGGCASDIALDEPIEGPAWRLVQLGDQAIAPSSQAGGDPFIQFEAASARVAGSGGCNRLSGSFTRSASTLQLRQLASTRLACADPLRSTNETLFIGALQSTAGYRMQAPGQLALIDASGRTLAVLSRGGGR